MKRFVFMALSAFIFAGILIPVSAADLSPNLADTYNLMKSALTVLSIIFAVLVLGSVILTIYCINKKKQGQTLQNGAILLVLLYVTSLIVLGCGVFCIDKYNIAKDALLVTMTPTVTTPSAPTTDPSASTSDPTTVPTTDPTTEPTTEPTVEVTLPTFEPGHTDNSDPGNWNIKWDILVDDSVVESYQRPEDITFGSPENYTALQGITTFRGDNYRTGATFGYSSVTDKTLSTRWETGIGAYNTWSGAGWTGQPLVVRWDAETKAIMNLYEDKKAKEDLVEIIYATLDGYIHFFDLDDGSKTRDSIWMGMNFKGAGSLDPRGYPILYVGSGALLPDEDYSGKKPEMYIVSLIDGSILYKRSGYDRSAKRGWYAFDSAPLVDAETDTLIWPGESGILYTIKLNTQFDKAEGTLSIDPKITVKTRYTTNTGRQLGSECSAIIVDRYMYCGDNGGMFICVDLNTMELVWAQDTFDDINATPVFRWENDGKGYIYTATSMEYAKGTTYIHKLDAQTGEIIWEKTFDGVAYNSGVSGGILSSPILGRDGTTLENMIVYSIARTPGIEQGLLIALDTQTGEEIWTQTMGTYTWSSPTAIYTEDGTGYIIICDAAGRMRLVDSATGETISSVNLGGNIEASPVVFENTIIVGTRGQKVCGININ